MGASGSPFEHGQNEGPRQERFLIQNERITTPIDDWPGVSAYHFGWNHIRNGSEWLAKLQRDGFGGFYVTALNSDGRFTDMEWVKEELCRKL